MGTGTALLYILGALHCGMIFLLVGKDGWDFRPKQILTIKPDQKGFILKVHL